MVEVPVPRLGMWKGNSVCVHGSKCVNDELVGRGGFSNLGGKGGIKHVDLKIRKKNLGGVIFGCVNRVFSG